MPEGRSRDEMLARFHVRTGDGRLLSGAAAFAEVWRATPGWRWLVQLARLPGMLWLMERGYRIFLHLHLHLHLHLRPGLVRAFVTFRRRRG